MRLAGRRIVGGRAEGTVLASPTPLSFLGGVDPDTGAVRDPESPIVGERMAGRILALPHAKGSTVGSYVLYGLRTKGAAPSAILVERAETILAVGAVLGDVPLVDRLPVDLLRTGDAVVVDADAAAVDVPGVREVPVVTAFLEREGRVLVVRRGERMGSFPGKWSGVSGFLEEGDAPEARARQEAREETGLEGLTLLSRGDVVRTRGDGVVYAVHPLRFAAPAGPVRLNWENAEHRWVAPSEIRALETVPKLAEAYEASAG